MLMCNNKGISGPPVGLRTSELVYPSDQEAGSDPEDGFLLGIPHGRLVTTLMGPVPSVPVPLPSSSGPLAARVKAPWFSPRDPPGAAACVQEL